MRSSIIIILTVLVLGACAPTNIPNISSMDQLEYKYTTKKIELSNDTSIAYIEEGEGSQTLLFIHGLGSYLPAWDKNISELASKYHTIAIDLPGYGKSSKGNYEYSMTYYAQIIQEFIKAKGIEKVTLVGHSMGGQIALTTALQYPDIVDNLVLIAPAGFEEFNKGQRKWFKDVMTPDAVRYTPVDQIRTNLAYNFYNMPEDAEFMYTDRVAMRKANDFYAYSYAVSKSVAGMVNQPIYDFLPKIKHNTLVIFGENDNLIPNRFLNPGKTSKYANDGASRMPNSKLIMLDKTGHFAQFENADAVNQHIIEFLD